MTDGGVRTDRRTEARAWVDPGRMCWRRQDEPMIHGGWMTDASLSGLAFLTATRDTPEPGESIEVTLGDHTRFPKIRTARVVRRESHDAYFSVVACESEAGLRDSDE